MSAPTDLSGIRIEESRTYFIQRDDVKWTDEEWADALRAAAANEVLYEAWENLPDSACVEAYVDDVILEGELAESEAPSP